MKNQKQRKKQKINKAPELTENVLKKLLFEAGFVLVNKKEKTFGKPDDKLYKGDTLIFPEGSKRGIPVK